MDPREFLEWLEDLLTKHMDDPKSLPVFRVQDTHLDAADITDVTQLVVTMRDGSVFRITVTRAGGTTGAQSGGSAGDRAR